MIFVSPWRQNIEPEMDGEDTLPLSKPVRSEIRSNERQISKHCSPEFELHMLWAKFNPV